jgi:molybdate transport system regulatory protein
MSKGKNSKPAPEFQPRIRIRAGRDIALGPGKAELLEQIAATGSIRQAALQLGMSYMRAWMLVKTMNGCFRKPLVEANRGGRMQGGARLTDAGVRAIELYRRMEQLSREAVNEPWRELQTLMKD